MAKRTINQNHDILDNVHKHGCILDTREIFLHSHPDEEDPGIDFRMATTLLKNLRFLEYINNDPIIIHLHNDGGEWYDTLGIYDTISNCSSHITCIGYGLISSGASVLIQASDVRLLMPSSIFMIHYGDCNTADSSMGFLATAHQLERDNKTMLDIYTDKCQHGEFFQNRTKNYIKKYLDKKMREKTHFYMTGEEAKHWGLIDGIIGDTKYPSIQHILHNK